MLASVLVAVPAVAADPEADYTASFDACVGVPSSDFSDVPMGHTNYGDINCIAYYGITKGTSATTYSPLMSVTREHMALFLTRLAKLVGIAVASDPGDAGFTDTADLPAKSQTAINQLADLGITKGTSATTYSPADNVKRGQMALFIARLMNKMTPIADGKVGLTSTTQYGYTPADVKRNKLIKSEPPIGSPFTDLGSATKNEYDAVTQLWELGVASGISDTSYAASTDMTRAAMAGFMAAVLDHSNARPAGLSIQATPGIGWGNLSPTVMASVRNDNFMPVEDQAVDVFSTTAGNNALRNDGTCNFGTNPDDVLGGDLVSTGDCVWSENDDATDADGNLIVDESDVDQGKTRTFYAWIGSKEGAKFDADNADEQTTSVTARYAQDALSISSTINARAENHTNGQKVDLRVNSSVTFTVQLRNSTAAADVARPGVKFRVEYRQGAETDGPRDSRTYVSSHEASLVTNDDGKVSWTVQGPADNPRVANQQRSDDIVFIELHPVTGAEVRRTTEDIFWTEEVIVLRSTSLEHPTYVLAGNPSIGATVRLWDQYGNSHRSRSGQTATITIGVDTDGTVPANENVKSRNVISRGYARWSRQPAQSQTVAAGTPIAVSYNGVIAYKRDANGYLLTSDDTPTFVDGDASKDGTQKTTDIFDRSGDDPVLISDLHPVYNDSTPADQTTPLFDARDPAGNVHVVNKANSQSVDTTVNVTHVLAKENKFLTDSDDGEFNPELVYSYDADDTFINRTGNEGVEISMAKFEILIDDDNNHGTIANDSDTPVQVVVLVYNVDGTSIFTVTADGSGPSE